MHPSVLFDCRKKNLGDVRHLKLLSKIYFSNGKASLNMACYDNYSHLNIELHLLNLLYY